MSSTKLKSSIRLTLLAATVTAAGACTAPGTEPASTPDGAGPTTVTATVAAGHDGVVRRPTVPPPVAAIQVAARFAHAWAHHDRSARAWWLRVAPYCEPGYADLLRSVDPANIPATEIIGQPVATSSTDRLVSFDIITNAGVLGVTVAKIDRRWLVTTTDHWTGAR